MARIDQAEIDRIKRETDIVQLIQSYGTKLKDRNGEELIGLCPIHDDKNPSLCVNRKKNEWICHGACKAAGDVIKWVIRYIQAMLGHAELSTTQIYTQVSIRKLQQIHGLTHPADNPQPDEETEGNESKPDPSARDQPPTAQPKPPSEPESRSDA